MEQPRAAAAWILLVLVVLALAVVGWWRSVSQEADEAPERALTPAVDPGAHPAREPTTQVRPTRAHERPEDSSPGSRDAEPQTSRSRHDLFGRVHDSAGRPVPRFSVQVSEAVLEQAPNVSSEPGGRSATTMPIAHPEGEFVVRDLPAGDYAVFLSAPDGSRADVVVAVPQSQPLQIELRMPTGIVLRVRGPRGGPVSRVPVYLSASVFDDPEASPPAAWICETDARGLVRFAPLASGRHRFRLASLEGFESRELTLLDETLEEVWEVPWNNRAQVRVVDESSEPVSGARVELLDGPADLQRNSGDGGLAEWFLVEPGRYRVRATTRSGAWAEEELDVGEVGNFQLELTMLMR